MMRFAVDTGGTFTDLVIEDGVALHLFKAPTTPANPVDGVFDVLGVAAQALGMTRAALLEQGEMFVHGTTTATNAVITGNTARTAFLTTQGHPDILVLREGGRIGLPLFDHGIAYPEPFVPRALTFEVPERIDATGRVLAALDEAAFGEVLDRLIEAEVEAVAVCLLWSIVNPVHELRVGELLRERFPDLFVSLSHRVNPSLREYRRASATALDAALKPVMSAYLEELEARLREAGYGARLLVVTSQGMMKDAGELAASPIHVVKSGPAMAPVAASHVLAETGLGGHAIVADTGGTTYDVALIRDGVIPESRETWIGQPYLGHMTGFPSVDISSVGAGGGSIAGVDAAGLLTVGPQSAGAVPGPACYGAGGSRATVTDAAVVLGFVDPDHFLGGRMALDAGLAREAIWNDVAEPLGLSLEDGAAAVMALATETMAGAIEDITVNQGVDPREAVLIGGGGAAGLNSVAIARRLGCTTVLFPDAGAAISAAGGLLCPLSDDVAEFGLVRASDFDRETVNGILGRLRERCEAFAERLFDPGAAAIAYSAEARYAQQIWEIKVPLAAGILEDDGAVARLIEDFHRLHREIFAFEDRDGDIEFVNWRARVSADLRTAPLGAIRRDESRGKESTERRGFLNGTWHVVPVFALGALAAGKERRGPAFVETDVTTLVIDADAVFRKDARGNLVVTLDDSDREDAR
jgi:N-methylhydantoinase A